MGGVAATCTGAARRSRVSRRRRVRRGFPALALLSLASFLIQHEAYASAPMQSTPESNTATKLNGSVGSDGGVTAARYATMSLRRALLLLPSPPPPHPPPPEPNDGPAVTAGTLDELRAAMALSRVLTVYLTADVLLDGRELPPVLAPLRLLGACGGDGLSPCILDGNNTARHFTVGAAGELELHNLVLAKGKAVGQPWTDGGAMFVYGKLIARRVTFRDNNAVEDGAGSGGAVAVHYGDALFINCSFEGNRAAVGGGALKVVGRAEAPSLSETLAG
mmetsp:Transcript_24315/g.60428  ORF Transcript_24315/g.60428 Transcript_24315/m.60428 type:complete len:277 (-) Transcript_24315:731-1561(-)